VTSDQQSAFDGRTDQLGIWSQKPEFRRWGDSRFLEDGG